MSETRPRLQIAEDSINRFTGECTVCREPIDGQRGTDLLQLARVVEDTPERRVVRIEAYGHDACVRSLKLDAAPQDLDRALAALLLGQTKTIGFHRPPLELESIETYFRRVTGHDHPLFEELRRKL